MQHSSIFICSEEVSFTEFVIINNSLFDEKSLIHLYVKEHSITKLKYFGKCTLRDPIKYSGSGKYWKRHIEKHGKEFVKTLKVWSFNHLPDATEFALQFSADNNIVESTEWANMISENGLDGGLLLVVKDLTKLGIK